MTNKILLGIKCSPETCIDLFTCYCVSYSECFIKYSMVSKEYHISVVLVFLKHIFWWSTRVEQCKKAPG